MGTETSISTIFYAFLIINAIICAGFCAFLAMEKNRDIAGWFMFGLFFSLPALIAIAGAPSIKLLNDEEKDALREKNVVKHT